MAKGINGSSNLLLGEYPAAMGKTRHDCALVVLVPLHRRVVVQAVRKQCQRQLRRSAAAIAPFKSGRTVIPQVETGIERPAVNGDFCYVSNSSTFVMLHAAPPSNWASSGALRCFGC